MQQSVSKAPAPVVSTAQRVFVGIALAGLLAACGDSGGSNGSEPQGSFADAIKVGVAYSKTGPGAAFSGSQVAADQMWAKRVNDAGGIDGRKVELVLCDDETTPVGGSQCGRDLEEEEVSLILAHSVTGAVLGLQQQVEDRMLVINGSPNILPKADTTYFQASPPVSATITAVRDFAEENGVDFIGVIAATDASGEAAVTALEKVMGAAGIKQKTVRVDPTDLDLSGQLTELVDAGAQLVYAAYSGSGASAVVRAYSSLEIKQPLVLTSANATQAFLEIISGYLPERLYFAPQVGVLVPDVLPADLRDRVQEFATSYEKEVGSPPDALAYLANYSLDTAEAVLRNVDAEPRDTFAQRATDYLESATVESLTEITYSNPDDHVAVGIEPNVVEWNGKTWLQPKL